MPRLPLHTLLLSRPLAGRYMEGLAEALRAAFRAVRNARNDYQARRDEARALRSIAHLNEHVLRDIGAPNTLIARAAARRQARDLHADEIERRIGL